MPGLPRNVASGGLVGIFPQYVKATLATSYSEGSYTDYTNTGREPSYWVTNAALSWEPLRKQLLLSLGLNNLFNTATPSPPRSTFATLEYRF